MEGREDCGAATASAARSRAPLRRCRSRRSRMASSEASSIRARPTGWEEARPGAAGAGRGGGAPGKRPPLDFWPAFGDPGAGRGVGAPGEGASLGGGDRKARRPEGEGGAPCRAAAGAAASMTGAGGGSGAGAAVAAECSAAPSPGLAPPSTRRILRFSLRRADSLSASREAILSRYALSELYSGRPAVIIPSMCSRRDGSHTPDSTISRTSSAPYCAGTRGQWRAPLYC